MNNKEIKNNLLPIPDQLKGKKVTKFENSILLNNEFIKSNEFILECVEFVKQPFRLEMFTEYFKGWKKTGLFEYRNKKLDINITQCEGFLLDRNGDDFHPQPETLSDFIDVMLKTDVKLKWRK